MHAMPCDNIVQDSIQNRSTLERNGRIQPAVSTWPLHYIYTHIYTCCIVFLYIHYKQEEIISVRTFNWNYTYSTSHANVHAFALFVWLISRTFSANEQYFSLTTNQLTKLSAMAYQPSKQGNLLGLVFGSIHQCMHFNPHVLEWIDMKLSLIPLRSTWIHVDWDKYMHIQIRP